MLQHYLNNLPLGQRYLELNSITRLVVCRHHLGEKSFQLWQMTSETIGTYETYKRKKDAIKLAKQLASVFNLPLLIE